MASRRPETIADGSYAVSRPLFIYVKNAHRGVIPGLNEFVAEYVSRGCVRAKGGYLSERGLIAALGREAQGSSRGGHRRHSTWPLRRTKTAPAAAADARGRRPF